MKCSIDVENVKREMVDQRYKARVVYTFTISNGFAKTQADVVLTETGAAIIEQKGWQTNELTKEVQQETRSKP
jgi:hypothetical protein